MMVEMETEEELEEIQLSYDISYEGLEGSLVYLAVNSLRLKAPYRDSAYELGLLETREMTALVDSLLVDICMTLACNHIYGSTTPSQDREIYDKYLKEVERFFQEHKIKFKLYIINQLKKCDFAESEYIKELKRRVMV